MDPMCQAVAVMGHGVVARTRGLAPHGICPISYDARIEAARGKLGDEKPHRALCGKSQDVPEAAYVSGAPLLRGSAYIDFTTRKLRCICK